MKCEPIRLPIPRDPSLRGLTLYAQSAHLQNPGGFSLSNRMSVTVH